MKAIAYLRVSTDKQAEHGLGLDIQAKAIRDWAKAGGHKVVATYRDEGVSGSNGLDTRPGLQEAFRAVEAGEGDALVVYRLDRLARKLGSQITWIEQLESKGRAVVSVTEPDVGQDEMRTLVRQILGAISEYERAVIVRRMQDGRAAKSAAGGFAYGSPAYGQRAQDGALVDDQAEQAVIARIRELRGSGASLRTIAATLTEEGHRPKRAAKWHPESLSKIIARL